MTQTVNKDRKPSHELRQLKHEEHLKARAAAGKPARGSARQSTQGLAKRAQKKERASQS